MVIEQDVHFQNQNHQFHQFDDEIVGSMNASPQSSNNDLNNFSDNFTMHPSDMFLDQEQCSRYLHFKKPLRLFSQIHSHCSTCIRPLRCIRMPVSFNQTKLSLEEKYSIILDVNYHRPHKSLSEQQQQKTSFDAETFICPVIRCTNEQCQMVMHYCKLMEHFLLCKYQMVRCINSNYGCPYVMLRGQISSHLVAQCPANVVHCSAEWNRLPLHSTEKIPQTQVFCSPLSLNIHDLDVALALRDQRMLNQLWSASRQMKRVMRGRLCTHPAVPIKPYIGIRTFRRIRSKNSSSKPADGSQLDSTNQDCSINNQQNFSYCDNIDEEKYINYATKLVEMAYHESLVEILKRTTDYYRQIYLEHSNDYRQSSRKKSNSICLISNTTNSSSNNNFFLVQPIRSQLSQFSSSTSINLPVLTDAEKLILTERNNQRKKQLMTVDDQKGVGNIYLTSPPPPPPPLPKCNTLSLEIPIRLYAFYSCKPRAMYTFRCGMDFRKDELASHSRDIHTNIHGGLDGWIEHRCPLFQYGCTFVHRRLSPICDLNDGRRPGSSIVVYNEPLETFAYCTIDEQLENDSRCRSSINGINSSSISPISSSDIESCLDSDSLGPSVCEVCNSSNIQISFPCSTSSIGTETSSPCSSSKSSFNPNGYPPLIKNLNDLPFEILQNIFEYLDGFSLNNLSFTSKRMRMIVRSFVKKKGYVILQWKRFEMEKEKYQWRVVYKKWLFSTAMRPILGWNLDSNNVMAKHLESCPFNDRNVKTQPYRVILTE